MQTCSVIQLTKILTGHNTCKIPARSHTISTTRKASVECILCGKKGKRVGSADGGILRAEDFEVPRIRWDPRMMRPSRRAASSAEARAGAGAAESKTGKVTPALLALSSWFSQPLEEPSRECVREFVGESVKDPVYNIAADLNNNWYYIFASGEKAPFAEDFHREAVRRAYDPNLTAVAPLPTTNGSNFAKTLFHPSHIAKVFADANDETPTAQPPTDKRRQAG